MTSCFDCVLQEQEFAKKIKGNNNPNLKKAEEITNQEGLELEGRIKSCQERKNKLGRVVNTKAQSMFEHEEKQVCIKCIQIYLFIIATYYSYKNIISIIFLQKKSVENFM